MAGGEYVEWTAICGAFGFKVTNFVNGRSFGVEITKYGKLYFAQGLFKDQYGLDDAKQFCFDVADCKK